MESDHIKWQKQATAVLDSVLIKFEFSTGDIDYYKSTQYNIINP